MKRLNGLYKTAVSIKKMTNQQADTSMSMVTPVVGYEALKDVDLVSSL